MTVMDEDNGDDDDIIMSCEIMVKITNGQQEKLQLTGLYKDKNAGEIMISINYLKDGEVVENKYEQWM